MTKQKAKVFKNEKQETNPDNFKIKPFSIDPSGQKIYHYQHGKTTVFVRYRTGGERLEALLLKHFIGVINAEK